MANDITFVLKARNEARRVTRAFRDDMKRAGTDTRKIRTEARRAARETDRLADQARRTERGMKGAATQSQLLRRGLTGLGRAAAGAAAAFLSFQTLAASTNLALDFNRALAETKTLIEGTPEELAQIETAAAGFVRQFGGNATSQVQAFYQAISAGATDLADATEQVRVANQLAVAGVTDQKTAIDIISTAVNSYGSDVLSASEASDSLFTAVRLGKTTIPELARALGRVVPIAKSAGVNFDELNATVATLTSLGISTAEAVTGVRGVLAAIIKPTSEAEKAAKALGIQFNTAGIAAAGGLVPFLEDLIEKTGGSSEALSQLFTGVEGLQPVLALAGGGLDKLNAGLTEFENKAGATQTALEKVQAELSNRFDVAVASIRDRFRQLGGLLLQVIVPALEAVVVSIDAVAAAFQSSNPFIQAAVTALTIFAGGTIVSGITKLAFALTGISKIIAGISAAMGASTAVGAAGLLGRLGTLGAVIRFAGLVISRHPIILLITTAITLARVLSGVLKSIEQRAAEAASVVNNRVNTLEEVRRTQGVINEQLREAERLENARGGRDSSRAKALRAEAEAAQQALDARRKLLEGNRGRRTGGGLEQLIVPDPVIPGGVTGTEAGGGGAAATNALRDAVNSLTRGFEEQLVAAASTKRELEEYKIVQQLQNAALQDGIALSPQVVANVLAQKDAYEAAAAAQQTFQLGVRQGFEDFVDSVQTSAEFARSITQEAFQGMANAVSEFVTTGKLSFTDLLTNLLGQISQFLANQLIIDFLGVGGGGQGGAAGGTKGLVGNILGSFFGGARAEGGPVNPSQSYLVGERGAELFVPRTAGTIVPAEQTREMVGGSTTFNMYVTATDADSFRRSQSQIEAQMARAFDRANRRNN